MSKAQGSLKFAVDSDGKLVPLPLSILMQTVFFGGNKGAGKTSAMKRLFEAAYDAGAQCIGIAPLGKWWSVRIAANGRGPGLRGVVVFGGRNGDVPLLAGSGRMIARVLVHKRLHAVLDVSLMRKNDRAVFLADFFEELMMLKKEERAPHAMVLFADEVQAIAPQRSTSKEVERLRELMGDFCRECRNYGAGFVMGAQRSANVDKDLLALVEMLVVMRTVHHIDRDVYRKWVDEKGDTDDDEGAWLKRPPGNAACSVLKRGIHIYSPRKRPRPYTETVQSLAFDILHEAAHLAVAEGGAVKDRVHHISTAEEDDALLQVEVRFWGSLGWGQERAVRTMEDFGYTLDNAEEYLWRSGETRELVRRGWLTRTRETLCWGALRANIHQRLIA